MDNEFLPSKVSPGNTFFTQIDRWNDSPSFAKRELATRVYTVFLSIVVGVLSSGLNIAEVMIKAPGVLFKYTFGYIPYHGGKLGDQLPKGFEIDEFLKHIYNVVVFGVMTTIVSPLVGGIDPRASVWIHIKLDVVFPDETSSFSYLSKREVKNTLPETSTQQPPLRTPPTNQTPGNQGGPEQETNDTSPEPPKQTSPLTPSTQSQQQSTENAPSQYERKDTVAGKGLFTTVAVDPQQQSSQKSPRTGRTSASASANSSPASSGSTNVSNATKSEEEIFKDRVWATISSRMGIPNDNQDVPVNPSTVDSVKDSDASAKKSDHPVQASEWEDVSNPDKENLGRTVAAALSSQSTPLPLKQELAQKEATNFKVQKEARNPELIEAIKSKMLRQPDAIARSEEEKTGKSDGNTNTDEPEDCNTLEYEISVPPPVANTQQTPPPPLNVQNAKPAAAKGTEVSKLLKKYQANP